MEIISVGYAPIQNKTTIQVRVSKILSDKVKCLSELYQIQLSGHYTYESEDLFDVVVQTLQESGISVLPEME